MSDLISREALIEKVKESGFFWFSKLLVIDALKKEESVPAEPQWIPCSERMPENNGNYMTCDEKGNIHIFWYDDCQKCPFNISEYHTRYYPVVAWMPLPQPYKGE